MAHMCHFLFLLQSTTKNSTLHIKQIQDDFDLGTKERHGAAGFLPALYTDLEPKNPETPTGSDNKSPNKILFSLGKGPQKGQANMTGSFETRTTLL